MSIKLLRLKTKLQVFFFFCSWKITSIYSSLIQMLALYEPSSQSRITKKGPKLIFTFRVKPAYTSICGTSHAADRTSSSQYHSYLQEPPSALFRLHEPHPKKLDSALLHYFPYVFQRLIIILKN